MNGGRAGWVIVVGAVAAWCLVLWMWGSLSGCVLKASVDYDLSASPAASAASAASAPSE